MNLDVKFFASLLIPRCHTYTLSFLINFLINYSGMKKLTTTFNNNFSIIIDGFYEHGTIKSDR